MILSADDFGISPGVDEGILTLIEKNKISSTSCMIVGTNPHLFQNLNLLKKYKTKIDVGLHLVLTETKPVSELSYNSGLINSTGHFHPLKALAKRAYLGQLKPEALNLEITSQIEKFVSVFNQEPDFIDGHQHIQQLPIIRNSVLAAMKSFKTIRYARVANLPNPWIWGSAQSSSLRFAFENLALAIPGRQSAELFAKNNIPHNRYLLGYYRHETKTKFKDIFKKYMNLKPQPRDIFFCHPGYVDAHLKRVDRLVDSRKDNLDFLLSAEFEDLCNINSIRINRFTTTQRLT